MKFTYRTGSYDSAAGWSDEDEQMLAAIISLCSEHPERRRSWLTRTMRDILHVEYPAPELLKEARAFAEAPISQQETP